MEIIIVVIVGVVTLQIFFFIENHKKIKKYREVIPPSTHLGLDTKEVLSETVQITEESYQSPSLEEKDSSVSVKLPESLERNVFYGGVMSHSNTFYSISSTPEALSTAFIFIVDESDPTKADFELFLEDERVKAWLINDPQQYLLKVCHFENMPDEETTGIITVKTGKVNFVDTQWKVTDDKDKAIVKFI